jgi:anti-sigma regulatory factor (Ser/Thr protein kinase)
MERRPVAMAAKQPVAGKRDKTTWDAVSMSALVRHNLTSAMANLFEAQVIRNEIFPAAKDQVARARKAVRDSIGDDPALDTVVLLCSELATNAVLHSGSSFFGLVVTRVAGGDLRVAITDEGRKGMPHLPQQAPVNESGRGTYLLDTLARRWGITRQVGVGVAVWFDAR